MNEPFGSRCATALGRARKSGALTLVVTKAEHVHYLSGFTGEDSWLILAARRRILVTDSRFTEEAETTAAGWQVQRRQGPIALEAAGLLKTLALPAGFEGASLSVETHRVLARALRKKAALVETNGLVESIRLCKDRFEIQSIRKAIAAAETAFEVTLRSVNSRSTESSVAAELEHNMRLAGAQGAAFPTISACEPSSSLPHAKPGSKRLCDSPTLLLDWGARVGRYNSDLTRVVAWGKVSPAIHRMYKVARAAQKAALSLVGPGIPAARVDAAARKVIADAGFGEFFGHGLGHGVGLEIHEGPTLSPKSTVRLKPGMVVTVEPGIYLPGVGGVRVEDMVLITLTGAEILTHVGRNPLSLGILAGRRVP